MTSILLIKTSSLGDVVHNLPVIADLRRALCCDVSIDWVVEKHFAAVPALHPHVRSVIPCEIRRWRGTWMVSQTRAEWRDFVHRLQGTQYDAILDTQGLFKSALIARIARGRRHGLNWRSSREPLRLFYDRVHDVPWDAHAVERNRRLCGLAMGYRVDGPPVYGLRAVPARMPWLPSNRYAVLLHGTSHPSKLWPESDWIALGLRLSSFGLDVVLPWGSDDERERAQRIAAALPRAVVLSKLGIDELAAVMAGAAAVIGVDTGLTHLAAALGLCVVGIYGATDPGATGVYAPGPVVNVGGRRRFPSVDEAISALVTLGVFPAASGRKGGA